ncbi:MAG: ATP-binding cassette domain-containing protein [Pseudomonadota bacterium]|nr:ATP-binding cassette domain-containing protein [Pseudomonadota bacterium]
MIRFENVSLRRGVKLLFEEASLTIHPGQNVGLTGRNGTGKSSLFALLLQHYPTDAGDISLPAGWVTAHVAQETPATESSALDYVLDGDEELRQLQTLLENTTDGARLGELHAQLDAIDGYRAESRAARLLHGLGFQNEEMRQAVSSFSGGWRMRLNLARALMCRSDLLLLDEPTNHLDLDAVMWLEEWLRKYPGTLLLISHDRDFLDSVCKHILNIEHHRATLYSGNYSAFEKVRAERLANQQAEHEKQQREMAHMQQYVDRFRAQATKAKQAQSRLKALQRMKLISPAHIDSPFHFKFLTPRHRPDPLMTMEKVATGYAASTPVIQNLNLNIHAGDRIGLLGPNGAGKSTLIKLLAQMLPVLSGQLTQAKECLIGYFAQHQVDQLNPDHSPFEHLRQLNPKISDQQGRNFLGGFGFQGERALERVAPFSGGEKARLALALIVYQRPNLLLLDEPTNHLDIEMRQALVEALQEFQGAMLIVSHDRFLLRATCDHLWLVDDQRVLDFKGDLDDYRRWLANRDNNSDAETSQQQHGANTSSRKDLKRQQAQQRQQLRPLRKKAEQLEASVEKLQQQSETLQMQLADSGIYQEQRKQELKQLLEEKGEIDAGLAETEEQWMQALEELEAAQQT